MDKYFDTYMKKYLRRKHLYLDRMIQSGGELVSFLKAEARRMNHLEKVQRLVVKLVCI